MRDHNSQRVAAVFALSVICLCVKATADMRIDGDRVVVGSMFAPFCRTEAADSSEWVADAESISKFLCGDVELKTDGCKVSFTLGPWQSIMLEAQ